MKQVLAVVLGAGLLLAGCGQNTPGATASPGTPQAAYGDGLDHSWTASTAEGQRLYAALSQGLKSQDFNIGLDITATSGWGPIELNTSNGETSAGDGKPITLNGKVYSTGLGLHANSEIHIHATNLETPACTRFQADVGLDDEVGDLGSVVFQVFADGVKLFDSGVMTGASATQHIDVGIGNKSDLRFVVTDAGDLNYFDHADWAGAAITCAPQAAPSLTLDKNSLNIYHLHTGILKAKFKNYPAGAVAVRLTADPFVQPTTGNSKAYPSLVLDTKTVVLNGAEEETKDLVISAPNPGVSFADPLSNFHLTFSVNGVDIQSIPVVLTESPLKFTYSFTPSTLSVKAGQTGTAILHMDIYPPLSYTPSLVIIPYVPSTPGYNISSVGKSVGDGGSFDIPVTFTVPNDKDAYESGYIDMSIGIPGIVVAYRDNYYGTLHAYMSLNLLP